jgi:hypothetical protein
MSGSMFGGRVLMPKLPHSEKVAMLSVIAISGAVEVLTLTPDTLN